MADTKTVANAFAEEMAAREAHAEKVSCVIWIAVILGTFILFRLLAHNLDPELVFQITILVAVMVPAFALIVLLIEKGIYSPLLRYFNCFLQVTLVSWAILFDAQIYGAQYALSSMPPMAYGLVLVVTAFRLKPALGAFAGIIAALEFGLLYGLVIHNSPDLTPALIESIPSLGWEVTGMKIMVLLGLGAACAYAAHRLNRQLLEAIERSQRQSDIERSFGRYVSDEIASQIVKSGGDGLDTRRTNAVVMFGDLRGFTSFSSGADPDYVSRVLNAFFESVTEAVNAEGGFINKFLGDGFLAVFGLFGESVRDAEEASIRAAFRLDHAVRLTLRSEGLDYGIAVTSGEVIAGEIGSEGRCEFTVIGSTVNLAARLEGLNRELDTHLLTTRAFADTLPESLATGRSMGTRPIRGIPDPVEVVALEMSSGYEALSRFPAQVASRALVDTAAAGSS